MEPQTQQYEVSDLVRYAYEGQPAKMQDVFDELMKGRLYDSIQQKKIEVAQRFFGPGDQEEPQEEDDFDYEDATNG
ncbi:MAG: hypothetical protein EB078_08945 [Proteobacteria bacterium]|nr:hypothetical protein [Pseudomonadota bacterium]NDD05020.1 hypothetical protein [Pseudomonadota bacterium]